MVKAWEIPYKHGDDLKTNIPFLTKLSDDINNPQFPDGSNSTASQLIVALDNPDIFTFYKKFANTTDIGELMRKRYLEAMTFSDGVSRKVLLEGILDQKIAIRELGVLSDDLLDNLSQSNLAPIDFSGGTKFYEQTN